MPPADLADMSSGASDIVQAQVLEAGDPKPLKSRTVPPEDLGEYVPYSVRVERVLKGEALHPEMTTTVWKFRYTPVPSQGQDLNTSASNTSPLRNGERVILILKSETVPDVYDGFAIVRSDLGVFDVQDSMVRPRSELGPLAKSQWTMDAFVDAIEPSTAVDQTAVTSR